MHKVKKYIGNIIYLLVILSIYYIALKLKFINCDITLSRDDHIAILTINSILAGFLFSSLGIMLSGMEKERIIRLEKGGYLEKYFMSIYITIFLNIISIVISFVNAFELIPIFSSKLNYIEIYSTIAALIFFLKCTNGIRKIINKMRNNK